MTINRVHVIRTDDCDGQPAVPHVPDPIPLPPPTLLPSPWQGTDPTRDDLHAMYGTADPAVLRRMPFVLAEDIAAAERYAVEDAPVAA